MRHDDPTDKPIDDRLEELAALLAAGFLRLKRRTPSALLRAGGCLPTATPACRSGRSESAESSKTPSDSTWRSSEPSALCPPR